MNHPARTVRLCRIALPILCQLPTLWQICNARVDPARHPYRCNPKANSGQRAAPRSGLIVRFELNLVILETGMTNSKMKLQPKLYQGETLPVQRVVFGKVGFSPTL